MSRAVHWCSCGFIRADTRTCSRVWRTCTWTSESCSSFPLSTICLSAPASTYHFLPFLSLCLDFFFTLALPNYNRTVSNEAGCEMEEDEHSWGWAKRSLKMKEILPFVLSSHDNSADCKCVCVCVCACACTNVTLCPVSFYAYLTFCHTLLSYTLEIPNLISYNSSSNICPEITKLTAKLGPVKELSGGVMTHKRDPTKITLQSWTNIKTEPQNSWWKISLLRDHPDERPRWQETTQMKHHPEERPPWWKTTLIRDHPNERPPWWETTLMKDHPDERPPSGKTTLMRQTTLIRDHPDERLPWWETTPMKDYPDERPPRWKTTLTRDHPNERPPW